MPVLLKVTEKEARRAVKRALITLPAELATVRCACPSKDCRGINVNALPFEDRRLQTDVLRIGLTFIERMAVRGFAHIGTTLWLHGPFLSTEAEAHLADVESSLWREAEVLDRRWDPRGDRHPELVAPMVYDRPKASPFRDYLLYGWFAGQETKVRSSVDWGNGDRSGATEIPYLEDQE